MKNTEKTVDFTTHVLLLFWISAKFPSIWYTIWSILSKKNVLLIWEEPFSENGKIKGLPTTSERVAKLRWIDRSKVKRNQPKKLVLTYLITESWFFPLLEEWRTNRICQCWIITVQVWNLGLLLMRFLAMKYMYQIF